MPYDKKNKYIFIHIPKVAGTSIEKHLGIYYKNKSFSTEIGFGKFEANNIVYSLQHITLAQLLELNLLTKPEINSFFKFCFVRNPWDRAVSGYKWHKRIKNPKITFREYLLLCKKHFHMNQDNRSMNLENCHFLPQSWYVFDKQKSLLMDFVGKYETLQTDMNFVLSKLNMELSELQNHNKSKKAPYFFYYYDIRNIFLVKNIYKEDIVNFKYFFFKSNALSLFFQKLLSKFKNKIKNL